MDERNLKTGDHVPNILNSFSIAGIRDQYVHWFSMLLLNFVEQFVDIVRFLDINFVS